MFLSMSLPGTWPSCLFPVYFPCSLGPQDRTSTNKCKPSEPTDQAAEELPLSANSPIMRTQATWWRPRARAGHPWVFIIILFFYYRKNMEKTVYNIPGPSIATKIFGDVVIRIENWDIDTQSPIA